MGCCYTEQAVIVILLSIFYQEYLGSYFTGLKKAESLPREKEIIFPSSSCMTVMNLFVPLSLRIMGSIYTEFRGMVLWEEFR